MLFGVYSTTYPWKTISFHRTRGAFWFVSFPSDRMSFRWVCDTILANGTQGNYSIGLLKGYFPPWHGREERERISQYHRYGRQYPCSLWDAPTCIWCKECWSHDTALTGDDRTYYHHAEDGRAERRNPLGSLMIYLRYSINSS